MSEEIIQRFLDRHFNRDWGEISNVDRVDNEWAQSQGGEIYSIYSISKGDKIKIVSDNETMITKVELSSEWKPTREAK